MRSLNSRKYYNRIMKKVLAGIFLIVLTAGVLFLYSVPAANLVRAQTNAPVYTPQKITPGTIVTQSNNIVNSNTHYDIVFRTSATGLVKNVKVIFPPGTNIGDVMLLEVSGIGPGVTSVTGQNLIYSITSPVTVTTGSTIRLEVGNIINPSVPGNSLKVQVYLTDSAGTVITSGDSTGYAIRQIGATDVADTSITSSKITDGQVATLDLANNVVTTAKLADNSVSTTQFSSKLSDGAVTTSKIAPGAITADKLAPNAVHVQITEKRSEKISITGGGTQGGAQAYCNRDEGEVATGGGFITDDSRVIVRNSVRLDDVRGNSVGWGVWVSNTDTTGTSHTIQVTAQCLKFIP